MESAMIHVQYVLSTHCRIRSTSYRCGWVLSYVPIMCDAVSQLQPAGSPQQSKITPSFFQQKWSDTCALLISNRFIRKYSTASKRANFEHTNEVRTSMEKYSKSGKKCTPDATTPSNYVSPTFFCFQ